jgi:hypothetical protein
MSSKLRNVGDLQVKAYIKAVRGYHLHKMRAFSIFFSTWSFGQSSAEK